MNQETNKTVNFLTIMPNNPLAKYLLSDLTILNSSGLVIFVSTLGIFQIWDTGFVPSNWKMRLLPGQFGLFMPLNQHTEKWLFYLLE